MKKKITINNRCLNDEPSSVINRILESRGIEDADSLLNPCIPDDEIASLSPYVERAAEAIENAIKKNKKFHVYADSDTDGVSAATIAIKYLNDICGVNLTYSIPQGKYHGTNKTLIETLQREHTQVLIVVDSLDSDVSNYKFINENTDVEMTIVLDHHDIVSDEYDKLDNFILVSSNRPECRNHDLCGAMVTWRTMQKHSQMFGSGNEADCYIDLAAVGTVADMMDLGFDYPDNREIVDRGLDHINNPLVKKVFGNYDINSKSVSFSLAPLVNAANRMGANNIALNAFLADTEDEVKKSVKLLKACKDKQGKEVDRLIPTIEEQLKGTENDKCLFIEIETDYGVSGLLGNTLLSQYHKPVFILQDKGEHYTGSMRSAGYGNIRQICSDSGLIDMAGHPEAAGIRYLAKDKLDELKTYLEENLSGSGEVDIPVDAEIEVSDITDDLIKQVKDVDRVSGKGFPALTFCVETDDFSVGTMTKGKHLKCVSNGVLFLWWNFKDEVLRNQLIEASILGEPVTFIGNLQASFVGRKYYRQMILSDIVFADAEREYID